MAMPAEPRYSAPDPREVDLRFMRRSFARAAATYDGAAVVQREVGQRMAQRLDYIKLAPLTILDAGCATGESIGELALRYPSACIVGVDAALPRLTTARSRARRRRSMLRKLISPLMPRASGVPPSCVCADIGALPLRSVTFDLIWGNRA